MALYRVGNQQLDGESQEFARKLSEVHGKPELRPVCLCRDPGIEMYVAKVADKFILKRMPGTGTKHDPSCDSYEYPPELSGLGEIMGSAIQEDVEAGTTALKFNFSLSKLTTSRAAPKPNAGVEKNTIKEDEKKLTLRSTLDYLWEEAGFSKWTAAMNNKRSWFVIRKYLLEAVGNKTAKGSNLGNLLYIPENFSPEHKDQIVLRRNSHLSKLSKTSGGKRELMLLVAEVKEMAPSRFGFKLIAKHLPDYHFMMSEKMYEKIEEIFYSELGLWGAIDNSHLIVIASFGLSPSGYATIEEISFMVTNASWIPIENAHEMRLVDTLIESGRSFTKALRYNLPSYRPMASVVLTDVKPDPTALYIVSQDSETYAESLSALMGASEIPSWVWNPFEEAMPAIPDKT
jgi:hypothetical protein